VKAMRAWTVSEETRLRELYGSQPIVDLMNAFPGRTASALHTKAFKLGLSNIGLYREPIVKKPKEKLVTRKKSVRRFGWTVGRDFR